SLAVNEFVESLVGLHGQSERRLLRLQLATSEDCSAHRLAPGFPRLLVRGYSTSESGNSRPLTPGRARVAESCWLADTTPRSRRGPPFAWYCPGRAAPRGRGVRRRSCRPARGRPCSSGPRPTA